MKPEDISALPTAELDALIAMAAKERTKRSEVACVEAASVEVFIVCPVL